MLLDTVSRYAENNWEGDAVNQCDGQLSLTDYFKQQIQSGEVKDLTAWINSQGKAQYSQIKDVVASAYEMYKDDPGIVDRITNDISVYVLGQSMGYMRYLKENC